MHDRRLELLFRGSSHRRGIFVWPISWESEVYHVTSVEVSGLSLGWAEIDLGDSHFEKGKLKQGLLPHLRF